MENGLLSQAIQQSTGVAVLAHGNPPAPLEAGKGEDPTGIPCDPARDSHRVRDLPTVPPPLPLGKAESLLGEREGLSDEVRDSLAHSPIMSILSQRSTLPRSFPLIRPSHARGLYHFII